MESKSYWQKRFENLEQVLNNKNLAYYKNLEKQYDQMIKEIEKDLSYWYNRYAKANGITLTEAKKILDKGELAEFKMTIEEYIEKGRTLNYSSQWANALEKASVRVHVSRLESIKLQMQQHIETLYIEQENGLKEHLKNAYSETYNRTIFEIQQGVGVAISFQQVDFDKVDKLLTNVWTSDGKNFSSRIWSNKQKLIEELNNLFTKNIARGFDPKPAIKEIAERLNVDKRKAGRLVMTESAFIQSASTRDSYSELDVKEYEILATLDLKTSEICRSMDGLRFPLKEYEIGVTAPPFHPNCRTTTIPYFDDEFTENEKRSAKGNNGKSHLVDGNLKYDDWLAKYVKS